MRFPLYTIIIKRGKLSILISLKGVIEKKLKMVVKLSEEIQELLEEVADFQADFDKYTDIEVSVRRDLTILSNFISGKQNEKVIPTPSREMTSCRLKLPRFEIKKFSGDPTNWKSFIESFNAAIHTNEYLSDIENMNFLINHVEDEAESVYKGFTT